MALSFDVALSRQGRVTQVWPGKQRQRCHFRFRRVHHSSRCRGLATQKPKVRRLEANASSMASQRKRLRGNEDSIDEENAPQPLMVGELFKRHRRGRIRKAGDRRDENVHKAIVNAQWDHLSSGAQQQETERIRERLGEGRRLSDVSDAPGADPPRFTLKKRWAEATRFDPGDITDSEGEEKPFDDDKDSSSEEKEVKDGAPQDDTAAKGDDNDDQDDGDGENEEESDDAENYEEEEESLDPYAGIIMCGEQSRNDTQSVLKQYVKQNPPDHKSKKWEGPQQVGAGSGGNITLWFAKDEATAKIIDRIAVKDQLYDPDEWSSIRLWYGDPRNWGTRAIMEATAVSNLNKAAGDGPGSQAIIGLLASRVYMKRMASRIIMSYCGHGDVDGIITRYQQAGEKIPEAFIWAVFNALAEACVLMKYGDIQSKKDDTWQQIVHQDINPKNIFLDSSTMANTSTDPDPAMASTSTDPDPDEANTTTKPCPRSFPSYQQPVLGDFGHSIITSRYDDLNPCAYAAGHGTPCFRAPEQFPWLEDDTLLPAHEGKLLSPTNVYQVGITIAAMMHCKPVQEVTTGRRVKKWDGPQDYVPGPDQHEAFEWEPDGVTQTYSKALRKLMRKCVEWEARDRVKATELKRLILKHSGGGRRGTADQAQGMRTAWPTTPAQAGLVMPAKLLKKDDYALGLSL
ncbi:hypothetical protein AC579_5579 [Pseudocercospora musae]|uniref:Protein kinase domain-containing protein n=1 Tax=Pseudocercospora musae TaxID=113226 RepID=A0A139IP42_9PEZI|nr:hypothetical protein AC579_5579 [Pseudocercospora musae]